LLLQKANDKFCPMKRAEKIPKDKQSLFVTSVTRMCIVDEIGDENPALVKRS
jgi:hypothetical protein